MRVVDTVDGDSIKNVTKSDVVKDQVIKTDGYKAYEVIKGIWLLKYYLTSICMLYILHMTILM